MPKLVINSTTAAPREIELKPGSNHIGRAAANDIHLDDASVSSTHCQILVNEAGVIIRDLGSTNGTFINNAPVTEAPLETGQAVRLGTLEMVFYSDNLAPVALAAAPRAALRPRLAISSSAPAAEANTAVMEPPPGAPPIMASAMGPTFCKFHPRSPARWQCPKCNRGFCDLCVSSRTVGKVTTKTCRSCGVETKPLQVKITRTVERGFFAKLPGAFVYPFLGMGSVILVLATITYAVLDIISAGLIAILAKLAFYGFVFMFMQNILHSTASDENENLSFPSADGLFGAAFQLAGTVLMSLGLAIGLSVAKFFEVDIPTSAIIAAWILGLLYFPMAFLAVAMKDTVVASNPLVVIPAILRVPGQYLVVAIVLMSVFGIRQIGAMVSGVAGDVSFTSREVSTVLIAMGVQAIWKFVSVYLLTVSMRILGLFYNGYKEELGWF